MAKEESRERWARRSRVVLSSDAISADAGYRSPRESKRRGPTIGEEQGLGNRLPLLVEAGRHACNAVAGVLQADTNNLEVVLEARTRVSGKEGSKPCVALVVA